MSEFRRGNPLAGEPLVWGRIDSPGGFSGTAVLVTCSQGHASVLKHLVAADGALHAPAGKSPSLHCGVCGENLPLRLGSINEGDDVIWGASPEGRKETPEHG